MKMGVEGKGGCVQSDVLGKELKHSAGAFRT